MPTAGTGTSSSSRPGRGRVLTRACMASVPTLVERRADGQPSRRHVGPVDDRVLDRADALDLAADPVAGLQEHRRVAEHPDARWRAGRDHVAGLEGDDRADERDEVGTSQIMSAVVPSCIRCSVPSGRRSASCAGEGRRPGRARRR